MRIQIINLLNAMFTDPSGVGKKTLTEVKFMLAYSKDIPAHERKSILDNIVETDGRFYFKNLKFWKP